MKSAGFHLAMKSARFHLAMKSAGFHGLPLNAVFSIRTNTDIHEICRIPCTSPNEPRTNGPIFAHHLANMSTSRYPLA